MRNQNAPGHNNFIADKIKERKSWRIRQPQSYSFKYWIKCCGPSISICYSSISSSSDSRLLSVWRFFRLVNDSDLLSPMFVVTIWKFSTSDRLWFRRRFLIFPPPHLNNLILTGSTRIALLKSTWPPNLSVSSVSDVSSPIDVSSFFVLKLSFDGESFSLSLPLLRQPGVGSFNNNLEIRIFSGPFDRPASFSLSGGTFLQVSTPADASWDPSQHRLVSLAGGEKTGNSSSAMGPVVSLWTPSIPPGFSSSSNELLFKRSSLGFLFRLVPVPTDSNLTAWRGILRVKRGMGGGLLTGEDGKLSDGTIDVTGDTGADSCCSATVGVGTEGNSAMGEIIGLKLATADSFDIEVSGWASEIHSRSNNGGEPKRLLEVLPVLKLSPSVWKWQQIFNSPCNSCHQFSLTSENTTGLSILFEETCCAFASHLISNGTTKNSSYKINVVTMFLCHSHSPNSSGFILASVNHSCSDCRANFCSNKNSPSGADR